MKENESPYRCHIFVCTNDRKGSRISCAEGDNVMIRKLLKERVKQRSLTGQVRVSSSGCMGLCDNGPNVTLYPQGLVFNQVSAADVDTILKRVEQLVLIEGD